MKGYIKLNKELPEYADNMETMITELLEREEFICTGNGCGADACVVHQVEI